MRSRRSASSWTFTRRPGRAATFSSSSSRPSTSTGTAGRWPAFAGRRSGDEHRARSRAAGPDQAPDHAPAGPVRRGAGRFLRDPLRPGIRSERRVARRHPARPIEGGLPRSARDRLAGRARNAQELRGQLPRYRRAGPAVSMSRPRHQRRGWSRRARGLGRGSGGQSHHRGYCRRGAHRVIFAIVKYIHILAAIVAVGLNISYAVWIVRSQRDPTHTAFALKGVKFLDDRLANPAYGLLLLTGLLMVILLPYPITTLWIDISLVLYAGLIVIGLVLYTPSLREQIKLAEAGETTSAEFTRLGRRGQILGQLLAVIVLLILAMMVFKPTL